MVPVFFLPMIASVTSALRIPALVSFLATLAANVLAFFSERLVRGAAINATVVTLIIGLTITLAASLYAIMTGLGSVSPPWAREAWGMFVPANAIPCISAIWSAKLIRWTWQWKFYVITKVSS
ncbi:DUF5455 family protein [Vibrio vulnificus]|uniref:DUF5455 family protein n=1 Tax=Vibrio vulnificus TaxID=672 RepID=UPI00287A8748|nr:DUF5455 family protein [Vibrio vulnificus]MDS1772513.1 DUF5455 family protein [Vibrio vulnificus]MDS1853054.1 DUF5455 family protein [Vibrio vulnificus]